MAGEIIRKGDSTSHGGQVLEGSPTDICHGQPIAYVGHKVHCPKCKGTFPIIEGVPTTTFYGKGVAIAGMKTACGATLIPTQFTDIVEFAGGAAPTRAAGSADAAPAALVAAGTAALAPVEKDKKITRIFWTYGPDEQAVADISRHYVDLNLHVETENYSAGERVAVTISNDAATTPGGRAIEVQVQIGADGSGKTMNAFNNRSLDLGIFG